MAGWFDPQRIAFDPQNPQGFDAQAAQRQLDARQELAKALMARGNQQGQMVSGWYVPPSGASSIMSTLASALGGYMSGKGVQDQGDIDKASREAYSAGRDLLDKSSSPDEYRDQAIEANPMSVYTYKNPQDVGPTLDELRGVQAMPVRTPQIETKPLPSNVPAQTATAAPATQAEEVQYEPYYDPMTGLEMGQQVLSNPVKAKVAPQVLTRALGGGPDAPRANIQFSPIQAEKTPEKASTFDIDYDAAERIQGDRVKYLKRAMAADRNKAVDLLERSGERGQVLSRALDAQRLAQMTKQGAPDEYTTTSLGDGKYVTTNKRTGETSAGGQTGMSDKDQREWIGVAQAAQKSLGEANQNVTRVQKGIADLDNARKLLGDVGTGAWQKYANSVASALPTEYGSKVKALRGYFSSAAFAQARETLMNNISDSDAKAFLAASPDDSWRVGDILSYMDRFENMAHQNLDTFKGAASQHQQDADFANEKLGRKKPTGNARALPGIDLFPVLR